MDREKLDNWIAHLRNKTVANGATEGEAANAAQKVAELEGKYGPAAPPGRPAADVNRRPRPRQPRGTVLVLSPAQHAALHRGQTVTLLRQAQEHRYRLADGFLRRQVGDGDETRHRIVGEQPNCRSVVVRYD